MRKAILWVSTAIIASAPFTGFAGELSAICNEPYGGQYRYKTDGKDPNFEKDGFKAASWSFFWNSDKPSEGLAVVQHSQSAGATVERQPAIAITNSLPSFISFVVPLGGAMWIYSVYPEAQVLFASRHGTGYPGETAVAGLFKASCKVAWKK